MAKSTSPGLSNTTFFARWVCHCFCTLGVQSIPSSKSNQSCRQYPSVFQAVNGRREDSRDVSTVFWERNSVARPEKLLIRPKKFPPLNLTRYDLGEFVLIPHPPRCFSCLRFDKDPETDLWSHKQETSFPCEKSVQNLNWVADWLLPRPQGINAVTVNLTGCVIWRSRLSYLHVSFWKCG